jgi:hypothetical protein
MAYADSCAEAEAQGRGPPSGELCRSYPERRKTRRPPHRAAHDVRVGHQPQDGEGAWPHDPAVDSHPGGRGDPVSTFGETLTASAPPETSARHLIFACRPMPTISRDHHGRWLHATVQCLCWKLAFGGRGLVLNRCAGGSGREVELLGNPRCWLCRFLGSGRRELALRP